MRLKALNKHTHIMYIEMENVTPQKRRIYRQVFKHNYAQDAHTHTHMHTHTLYRLMYYYYGSYFEKTALKYFKSFVYIFLRNWCFEAAKLPDIFILIN